MDNFELRLFLSIKNSQSISETANEFFMSQSSVSSKLMNLEKELNVTLFERGQGHRKTILSNYGEKFVPIAEEIIRLNDLALKIKDNSPFGIRISTINSFGTAMLPKFLNYFINANKNIKVSVTDHSSQTSHNRIKSHEIDVAIVNTKSPFSGITDDLIIREKFVVVINETAEINNQSVKIADLNPSLEIFEDFNQEFYQWYNSILDTRNCKAISDSAALTYWLLASKGDWSILPLSVAQYFRSLNKNLQLLNIEGNVPLRTCYVEYIQSPESLNYNQIEKFVSELKQYIGY